MKSFGYGSGEAPGNREHGGPICAEWGGDHKGDKQGQSVALAGGRNT
mgnify:CR=1 FL=1